MRLDLITDSAGLVALAPAWAALMARSAEANTFLGPDWVLTWLQSYRPDAAVRSIAIYDGNSLVGLAPLMVQKERRTGIGMRCLRFIGDGTHETDHMDFLVAAEGGPAIRNALVEGMLGHDWDQAVLCNIPETSPSHATLNDWVSRHGFSMERRVAPGPARDLPESFDAVIATLPSRFRTAIRSTRRKLAASYKVEFGIHTKPEELDGALDALFANHESRWRARGQSGVFVNERRQQFYRTLSSRLLAIDALRFFFLKLDDRIVAQEYCFQHAGTVYLLQEGFDFALAKENVGNALRSFVFEYLIQNGYKRYDFLGGVTRHKLNWSNVTLQDVTIAVSRDNWRGRLSYHGPRAIEQIKDRLRPIRDRLRKSDTHAKPAGDAE